MKQRVRWMVAMATGITFVVAYMLTAASSGATYGVALASGALTPTASPTVTATVSVYLPYVTRQEPPTPTPTPTPTNVPIPTNTPTPTATTAPSGVYVLSNHSSYVDSIDYLHIVGEVQNNTANNLRFVKITANIFNNTGQLLDTDFTYIFLDNLPAGDKTCFHILLNEPAGWSYFEFEAPTYSTDGEPLPNLAILNDSGSYDSTFGWYQIIGQVRNDEGTRVEYVSPVGTVYSGSGVVVGCDFTYINSTHLETGQTSAFKMIFSGRNYADITSYRLQVDGNPQ